MKTVIRLAALLAALSHIPLAQSLALGAAELHAAKALGCVLAEDALGYLTEEQFNERFDDVVDGLSDATTDVVYAQALGYIDGLLFGISGDNPQEAMSRLESLSNSQTCSRPVRVGVSL